MSEIFKRPLAEADLDNIWDYIEERSSQEQAEDFLRKLGTKMNGTDLSSIRQLAYV